VQNSVRAYCLSLLSDAACFSPNTTAEVAAECCMMRDHTDADSTSLMNDRQFDVLAGENSPLSHCLQRLLSGPFLLSISIFVFFGCFFF